MAVKYPDFRPKSQQLVSEVKNDQQRSETGIKVKMETGLQKVDTEREGGEEEYDLCDPLDPDCIRLYEKIKEAWLEYIRKDKEKKETSKTMSVVHICGQDVQDEAHPIGNELDHYLCSDIQLSEAMKDHTQIERSS